MKKQHIWVSMISVLSFVALSMSANAEQVCTNRIAKQDANRFSISTDGTEVTDTKTGLIWQRCNIGQTWDGKTCKGNPTNLKTWKDALTAAKTAGGGYRLPTMKESMSIVDYSCSAPALDSTTFPNVPIGLLVAYWTSTPLVADGSSVMMMDYNTGSNVMQNPQMFSKTSLYFGSASGHARLVKNK